LATELSPVLKQRFFDANGVPLAGGMLYSYEAGTSTPKPTYTNYTGLTPNPNPVILDANGYANVWLSEDSEGYKFILEDSLGNLIFTVDDVFTSGSSGIAAGTVLVSAQNSAATSLASGITDIPFPTILRNLNSCFVGSTGVFTAPTTGFFQFNCALTPNLTDAANTEYYMQIASASNTDLAMLVNNIKAAVNYAYTINGSCVLSLAANATAKIRFFHNESGSRALEPLAIWNYLSVVQLA
jgi:hypothetical protein